MVMVMKAITVTSSSHLEWYVQSQLSHYRNNDVNAGNDDTDDDVYNESTKMKLLWAGN